MASLSNPKNDPKFEPESDSLIKREKMTRLERENKEGKEFDHGAPPPFTLADVRAAIPKHCWVKDPWKSMSYVVRDLVVVFALMAIAASLDSWVVWPFYWFAQGIMFWALFVLGHDCGHGSFSNSNKLNKVVGHILHTLVLVPYHGWRISHRIHHANHGHVENDESWRPTMGEAGKARSHFHPKSELFDPSQRWDVITSTIYWAIMVALLAGLGLVFGPVHLLKLYGLPYVVFVMWFAFVTYLQHHGDGEERLPRYRGKEWNYLQGALSTLDRDYGVFNNIHHGIGIHVLHHLFPQIPHYHLVEATKAAKPILGKYYKEPKKSAGPFPFHVIGIFLEALRINHFVSDSGGIVFYETDPYLTIDGASKYSM